MVWGGEVKIVTEIVLFRQIEVLSAEKTVSAEQQKGAHRNTFCRIYGRIIAEIIRQTHYTVVL